MEEGLRQTYDSLVRGLSSLDYYVATREQKFAEMKESINTLFTTRTGSQLYSYQTAAGNSFVNTAHFNDQTQTQQHWNTFWNDMESSSVQVDVFLQTTREILVGAFMEQQQKRAIGIESNFPTGFEVIQDCFNRLAQSSWENYRLVQACRTYQTVVSGRHGFNHQDESKHIGTCLTQLLTAIRESFMVEKQPLQILTENKKPENGPVVTFAVGNILSALIENRIMSPLKSVKATPVRHKELSSILSGMGKVEKALRMTNTSAKFTRNLEGRYIAAFSKMELKARPKDKAGREGETVAEQKYFLLFQSDITFDGKVIPLRCVSLPFVFTKHTSQLPIADAAIVCDNLFRKIRDFTTDVRDMTYPWETIAEVVTLRFKETGRELSVSHLDRLKKIVMHNNPSSSTISYDALCKTPILSQKCGFWVWLFDVMKVINETDVGRLWREGFVEGFINSEGAEALLKSRDSGTFLLRFSESAAPGSISTSRVHEINGVKSVFHLHPVLESNKKGVQLVATEIREDHFLTTLYPDRPKETVFPNTQLGKGPNGGGSGKYWKPFAFLSALTMGSFQFTSETTRDPSVTATVISKHKGDEATMSPTEEWTSPPHDTDYEKTTVQAFCEPGGFTAIESPIGLDNYSKNATDVPLEESPRHFAFVKPSKGQELEIDLMHLGQSGTGQIAHTQPTSLFPGEHDFSIPLQCPSGFVHPQCPLVKVGLNTFNPATTVAEIHGAPDYPFMDSDDFNDIEMYGNDQMETFDFSDLLNFQYAEQ